MHTRSAREWSSDVFFFFQAEDGIRYYDVTGVQTCALPISGHRQDPSRFESRRGAAPLLQAHPVHPRPDAERHHGDGGDLFRPGDQRAGVQVSARTDLRQRSAVRRLVNVCGSRVPPVYAKNKKRFDISKRFLKFIFKYIFSLYSKSLQHACLQLYQIWYCFQR